MKRFLITLGFTVAISIGTTACQRDAEPVPDTAPATEITPDDVRDPAPAPAPATDATQISDATSPVADAPRGFDTKAFAGTFAAPGATLTIDSDGRYRMTVRAESANANLTSTGTWRLEADGRQILLDPESKSDPDRRYALVPNDELQPVEGGEPLRRRGD
jgi:copper homeostasis protein (lipoprotein)